MPKPNAGYKNFFAFLISALFIRQILIALAVFLVLLFVLIKGLDIVTHHGEELEVPAVVNLQISEASKILKDRGFNLKVDSQFVTDKPGGMIIDQSPEPNDKVKAGRTIYLTMVTYLAPNVHLPRFEDTPLKEYESLLASVGLSVDSETYKPDIARDLVLGVTYKGGDLTDGASLPKGSKVNLILGDGNGGVQVLPNLVGLSLSEAKFSLMGAGLLLGQVHFDSTSHDTASAKIYRQNPPAKADTTVKVSQGTLIDVYLKN